MQSYLKELRNVLVKDGPAYGFTLTIWSTGILGSERYGKPSELQVLCFIGGAILAYALLALLLHPFVEPLSPQPQEAYGGMTFVHIIAVPAALSAAVGIYHGVDNSYLGLALASFTASIIYNVFLALKRLLSKCGAGVHLFFSRRHR